LAAGESKVWVKVPSGSEVQFSAEAARHLLGDKPSPPKMSAPSEAELKGKTSDELAEMANIARGQGNYPGKEITLQRIRSERLRRQAKQGAAVPGQKISDQGVPDGTYYRPSPGGLVKAFKTNGMSAFFDNPEEAKKWLNGDPTAKQHQQAGPVHIPGKGVIGGRRSGPATGKVTLEKSGAETKVHLDGRHIGTVKKNTQGSPVYGRTKVTIGHTAPRGWRSREAAGGPTIGTTHATRAEAVKAVVDNHHRNQAYDRKSRAR
jgi:hypothetical protein